MNVAIFSPYRTVAPHFETELEIAARHQEQGDCVEFIQCLGELPNCDFNPNKDPSICMDCRGRREAGLIVLEARRRDVDFGIEQRESEIEFDSIEHLKAYKIGNFDIGYAALSSLVSILRTPHPDLKEHQELLNRFIRSAKQSYRFTLNYLAQTPVDRVYVFNARFASVRAVLRACQATGTECWVHERGCDLEHYELFPNHMPHDIPAVEKKIQTMWRDGPVNKREIATRWYENRVNRVESNWHSFTKNQDFGRLPADWLNDRRNVTIFTSSDDEFVAIGDHWNNLLYPDQVKAIAQLARDICDESPATKLYVRVHPNTKGANHQQQRAMLSLELPNLTVIPPETPIDTYEMIRRSDQVVSFGSSVGIEAVYWNKPSVLLGPSFYRNLGGTYQPQCHRETLTMIKKDLTPQSPEGALKYGFWAETRGIRFRDFHPDGLFFGTFRGRVIHSGMHDQKESFSKRTKRFLRSLVGQS